MADEESTANGDEQDADKPLGWLDRIIGGSDNDWTEQDKDTNEPVDKYDPTGRKRRRLAEQRQFVRTGMLVLGLSMLAAIGLNILGWAILILDTISHQSLFDFLAGIFWTGAYALGAVFTIGVVIWSLRFGTLNSRWRRSKQIEQSLQALTPEEIEAQRLQYNLQTEDEESSKGRNARREVAKNLVWTLIGVVLGTIASNWGTIYDWLTHLPLFSR